MITTGMVYLVNKHGGVEASYKYHSPSARKKAIEQWKKIYGEGFYKFALQIDPNVDTSLVKVDGTNRKRPVKEKSFA